MMQPWLSIIGIGEDGAPSLTPAARALIAQATLIVGGARHLALIGETAAARLPWPSPLADALPRILAQRGRPTVVLASGDPFFYGVGDLLTCHVARAEMFCIPSPSAFSLAAARLMWSQQDCALVSLHGRAFERIARHLQPGARILALSWDETTPARIAAYLAARRMGGSRLIVLERLGGAKERVRETRADAYALDDVDALNTVAIDVEAEAGAPTIPCAPGLPDECFENDGQLTKRDIRAITLSALAPHKGETLWDIGAGAGSIAIEWMLTDNANRAVAIERDPARAARIARNALVARRSGSGHCRRRRATGACRVADAAGDLHRRRRQRGDAGGRLACAAGAGATRRQRRDARDATIARAIFRDRGRRTHPNPDFPRPAGRALSCARSGHAGDAMAD